MANSITHKDVVYKVGDMITVDYKIKEGEKERIQPFKGIIIQIRGNSPITKTITVRKISKSGIGVERIFPLMSPQVGTIKLDKKSSNTKAKLYFSRNLNESQLRYKLFRQK